MPLQRVPGGARWRGGTNAGADVACSDGGFGVAWVTRIEDTSQHEGYVAIAWSAGRTGALVTYEDPTEEELFREPAVLWVFEEDGAPAVTGIPVAEHGSNHEPDMVAHDGDFFLVYMSKPMDVAFPDWPWDSVVFARYGCVPPD